MWSMRANYAAKKRQIQENHLGKYQGRDESRKAAEAGGGDSSSQIWQKEKMISDTAISEETLLKLKRETDHILRRIEAICRGRKNLHPDQRQVIAYDAIIREVEYYCQTIEPLYDKILK